MRILKSESYSHTPLRSAKSGEEFSRSAVLSAALGSEDFFVHHDILAPGKRTSTPHFHERTEEFVYVIKGCLVAVEGAEEVELAPGDCGLFAASSGALHTLENRSSEVTELLVISRKLAQPDVRYERA